MMLHIDNSHRLGTINNCYKIISYNNWEIAIIYLVFFKSIIGLFPIHSSLLSFISFTLRLSPLKPDINLIFTCALIN